MNLVIIREGAEDWSVWAGLEGDYVLPPLGLSFVIGSGETLEAAKADAIAKLEAAIAKLRAPRGAIPETARSAR
jgi:hypothetical protein